jgi:hypothetical protein
MVKEWVNWLDSLTEVDVADVCLMTGEILEIKYEEAASEDYADVLAKVLLDTGRVVDDLPIHYHCEGYHQNQGLFGQETLRTGFEAFSEGDRVIIFKTGLDSEPLNSNSVLIGFEDGLPHPCFKCKGMHTANVVLEEVPPSGPYPDARIREATEDDPVTVASPYTGTSPGVGQLYPVGGVPPFEWSVDNAYIGYIGTGRKLDFSLGDDAVGDVVFTVIDANGHERECHVHIPGCDDPDGVPTLTLDNSLGCGETTIVRLDGEPYGWSPTSKWQPYLEEDTVFNTDLAHAYIMIEGPACDHVVTAKTNARFCMKCRAGLEGETEICKTLSLTGSCGEGASISAATTSMACSASQTLSVNGGSAVTWEWEITGGGRFDSVDGSDTTDTGDEVTLYAPSMNTDCADNSVVTLKCTDVLGATSTVDTLSVTFNCNDTDDKAYQIWNDFVCAYTNPYSGACRCNWSQDSDAYNCAGDSIGVGTQRSGFYVHNTPCTCSKCESALYNYWSGVDPDTLPGVTEDTRTSTMITNGCCPEALM